MKNTFIPIQALAAVAATSLFLLAQVGVAHADAQARDTGTLTDAQIVKIVHTANDGEIQQAKEAEKQSSNPDVKNFAKMMIDQHMQVNKDLSKVAKSEHIKPQNSTDASSLKQGAESTLSSLKSLKGADFDRAYVTAQVKAHQDVLDSIDNNLLPNAKDAKLQAMLQKVRPSVAMHLQHAKKLQTDLGAATT